MAASTVSCIQTGDLRTIALLTYPRISPGPGRLAAPAITSQRRSAASRSRWTASCSGPYGTPRSPASHPSITNATVRRPGRRRPVRRLFIMSRLTPRSRPSRIAPRPLARWTSWSASRNSVYASLICPSPRPGTYHSRIHLYTRTWRIAEYTARWPQDIPTHENTGYTQWLSLGYGPFANDGSSLIG